jgi:hypothetical protein
VCVCAWRGGGIVSRIRMVRGEGAAASPVARLNPNSQTHAPIAILTLYPLYTACRHAKRTHRLITHV